MTITVHSFRFAGLKFGSLEEGDDFTVLGQAGITGLGQAPRRTQLNDSSGPGQVRGASSSLAREITAKIRTNDRAKMLALVAAMDARPDPYDLDPWTFNGFLWDTGADQRIYVAPERCEPTVDTQAVGLGDYRADVMWIAPDPTVFSDVLHEEAYGGTGDGGPLSYKDVEFTNAGLSRSLSPQAWTWRLTAHGTVTDPYLTNQDDTDQSIRFTGLTMTSGQVLEVDVDRTCLIGTRHVEGLIRSRGQKFPYWPIQAPGENTWRVGAISGNVSGLLRHRDTWTA